MSSIEILTALSDDDRASIITGVVAAIRPLLDTRLELVFADTVSVIGGVSPATLDRLRKSWQLLSVKTGNRRLCRAAAVIATPESMNMEGSGNA
ncbi:hypothetical protein FF011L_05640 [Roseimaritima multifibrata]|uniref:Uncharacterized protein n=1 Tax=Roseimaritima multifibrata TaxID=1930274 RepID=A0A517MAB5_9BACT|nr:hypothetical protein [Roseimaritima multifibrata]QDS91829.1 hypothetical protein FF011L_05640 [Roseimaritima multifibrata]